MFPYCSNFSSLQIWGRVCQKEGNKVESLTVFFCLTWGDLYTCPHMSSSLPGAFLQTSVPQSALRPPPPPRARGHQTAAAAEEPELCRWRWPSAAPAGLDRAAHGVPCPALQTQGGQRSQSASVSQEPNQVFSGMLMSLKCLFHTFLLHFSICILNSLYFATVVVDVYVISRRVPIGWLPDRNGTQSSLALISRQFIFVPA